MTEDMVKQGLIMLLYFIFAIGNVVLYIVCETKLVPKEKRVDTGWLLLAAVLWPLTNMCVFCIISGKFITKALEKFRDEIEDD